MNVKTKLSRSLILQSFECFKDKIPSLKAISKSSLQVFLRGMAVWDWFAVLGKLNLVLFCGPKN